MNVAEIWQKWMHKFWHFSTISDFGPKNENRWKHLTCFGRMPCGNGIWSFSTANKITKEYNFGRVIGQRESSWCGRTREPLLTSSLLIIWIWTLTRHCKHSFGSQAGFCCRYGQSGRKNHFQCSQNVFSSTNSNWLWQPLCFSCQSDKCTLEIVGQSRKNVNSNHIRTFKMICNIASL